MPPAAASYQRTRPQWFGDPAEILREWQVGYLPNDSGGDRTGGTMRGKIVFPVRRLDGRLLAWCGRDPDWETKQREWLSLSEEKRSKEPEPMKWRFPKGFHRGSELWGQERILLRGSKKRLKEQMSLFVCEGPGDVIRLTRAGVLAVGLMSNQASREQTEKLARLAWEYADGHVQILLDLDVEGRKGCWRLLQQLSPLRLRARRLDERGGHKQLGQQATRATDGGGDRGVTLHDTRPPSRKEEGCRSKDKRELIRGRFLTGTSRTGESSCRRQHVGHSTHVRA